MTNPWDKFWLSTVHPHALAITRIGIGIFLLVYAGLYAPNVTMTLSNEGLVLPLYADRFPDFALFLTPASPFVAHIIYAILMLGVIGFTLGMYFRTSTVLLLITALYVWQLQLHFFPTSYNRILFLCLLVLLFSGAAQTLSVDMWRKKGSFLAYEPISVLPQRLLAIQISATFLGVSLQKWYLPGWQGGEILYYTFMSRWSTPIAFWYLNLGFDMAHYDFLVWVVKIFQPLTALTIWIPRLRFFSAMFLISFLILISVMLAIWWFVFIIPALVLFYNTESVYLWCKRLSTK